MNRLALLVASAGLTGATAAEPTIRLRYAAFDPLAGVPHVPASVAASPDSRVFIVQFGATPGSGDRAAFESRGVAILAYIPDHAYVVRVPAGLNPAQIPGVRWAGPYHAAYKLDEALLGPALAPERAHPAPVRCGIELFDRGAEAQAWLDALLRARGARVERFDPLGRRVEAMLTPSQLLAAARSEDVAFIDPTGPPGANMDIVRRLAGANYLQAQTGATGQGVRGELIDIGLDTTHPAFQNPAPLLHGPNGPRPDCHSTRTYGILFASDPLTPRVGAMLPGREQGIFASFYNLVSLQQHLAEIVDPQRPYRGVFQSASWGNLGTSWAYTSISAQLDDALFHVDLAVAQSWGNSNTFPNEQPLAKNVIAVGGIFHQDTLTRTDDWAVLSGPALDGRVKPDVAHVIDNVSTLPCTGSGFSGTSASTPIVAGHVGLICQLWHEGAFSGFGGGASVFDDRPKATTIRALLVNSAYQYDWSAGGPNASITRYRQGWGMPDLQPLYDRAARTFVVNETDVLVPLGVRTYRLTVPRGETALKATMVYLDPPGSPAVLQARVNDLTLRVISPGGVVYWGNWGLAQPGGGPAHGLWSAPGGTPDTKNVIENVYVQDPRPGEWTIEVGAPELVMDARLETSQLDADYALVVSGILPDQPCYPDCNADGSLTVADFGCFQTRFVAADPYADCNGDGSLTVADFGCFQTKFVTGCE